jgi:hypothetical protein
MAAIHRAGLGAHQAALRMADLMRGLGGLSAAEEAMRNLSVATARSKLVSDALEASKRFSAAEEAIRQALSPATIAAHKKMSELYEGLRTPNLFRQFRENEIQQSLRMLEALRPSHHNLSDLLGKKRNPSE